MPFEDATSGVTSDLIYTLFGKPTPPPQPPTAPPTLNAAPIVSSTPGPGRGVALDSSGNLPGLARFLPVLTADPAAPRLGQFWFRSDLVQLSICVDGAGTVKRVTLS